MNNELKELAEISQHFGKDPEYVLAGGGNTSYKNQDYLWIKASGTSLATITEDGFVKMDRHGLNRISEKIYSEIPLKRESEIIKDLFDCVAEKSEKRPSVETSLHNLLNFKFVVHTHPTIVNGLLCAQNSSIETRDIFGEEVLLIEYTDPGYTLFKLVEKRIREYVDRFGREPQIIFLENHGVFVSANNIEEIKDIYSEISASVGMRIQKTIPSPAILINDLNALKEQLATEKKMIALSFNSNLISEFTKSRDAFNQADLAFSPDNIVYCKAHYLFSKPDWKTLLNDLSAFEKQHGYNPKVIAIENKGIICLDETANSANTVYNVYLDLLKISFLSRNFGGPRFMNQNQIEFIDSWEVENYRRKVSKES